MTVLIVFAAVVVIILIILLLWDWPDKELSYAWDGGICHKWKEHFPAKSKALTDCGKTILYRKLVNKNQALILGLCAECCPEIAVVEEEDPTQNNLHFLGWLIAVVVCMVSVLGLVTLLFFGYWKIALGIGIVVAVFTIIYCIIRGFVWVMESLLNSG
ncbi:hypothetical protein A2V71_01965 [Candidatus Berkelbacteria bacterium RBG_13_40_8]|uniref:Uncharacterized protein n=1 Tax=Candidatus Berkelbacteria bacterium RBG_13_40_8 TaxID=1797467 RepID=A0A1F5DPS2_9BACT|nr:MAG: hypothetical protein A2V71_01965 [Candidatus Berkelbacteria bacterium RBG_13_40_8]